MVKAKEVSRDAAREVLTRLVEEGGDPRTIVKREGLGALTAEDEGLGEIVDRAIASDPAAAEQVRSGNMKAIGPLVGYVMRETKGRADGGEITRLMRERLEPNRAEVRPSRWPARPTCPRHDSQLSGMASPSVGCSRRRDSLRTTKPAPRSMLPPATSRTMSRPVKGSVPAEFVVVTVVEPLPVPAVPLLTVSHV